MPHRAPAARGPLRPFALRLRWLLPLLVAAAGCGGPVSRPPAGPPPAEGDVRLTPGQEHRVGDVGVTVRECVERDVSGRSPGGDRVTSRQRYTCVGIALKNYNPARNATLGGQTGRAVVTDDLGNTLRDVAIESDFGFEVRVNGQIKSGHRVEVRADEPGGDVLVVERTVPAAKVVTVTLDAAQYGGTGRLVVTLPIGKPKAQFPQKRLGEMLVGRSQDEVRDLLGKPDKEEVAGAKQRWHYFNRLESPSVGEFAGTAVVVFGADGRVERVDRQ